MGYKKNTIYGVSWMGAFRVISRALAFIRTIILARLLAPSEFGIFGIVTIILSLLEILTETGINIFMIQEKSDFRVYINDAWLVSIIRGLLMAVIIVISAPFISSFFKIQQATGIIYLIALVPFIKGFINPSEVIFQKELQFKKEFYFRIVIFAFDSFVAVLVSIFFHSALGMVLGLISGALLEVILSLVMIKPRPGIKFNIQKISIIFHNGKWVTLYGIFNYVSSTLDNIVVGRVSGTSSLGIYQMGYTIATMPISEVSDVANKVTFPVYSKISDDLFRLKSAFNKSILLVSIVSVVVGLVIFFFPKELFILIFGKKWSDTLIILKPLAIFGTIRAITGFTATLFLSVGKQKYVAGMTFTRLLTLTITIIPLTLLYGNFGASLSVLSAGIAEIPLTLYYVRSVFKLSNKNLH